MTATLTTLNHIALPHSMGRLLNCDACDVAPTVDDVVGWDSGAFTYVAHYVHTARVWRVWIVGGIASPLGQFVVPGNVRPLECLLAYHPDALDA